MSSADQVSFAHNSERQLARLFDFYGIAWEYEPHCYELAWAPDGSVTEAFSPDFYLPEHDRYLEVTTMRQDLVTRKNRKVRRLRELYPDVDVRVVYQRDYLHLLVRFGLEPPSQRADVVPVRLATDTSVRLLEQGPVPPRHPSSPAFRRAS